jgi:squalene cyclase
VRVLIDNATRVQPELLATGIQLEFFRDLETAIGRSQQYLLRAQKPEGYWVGELMVDSTLVSDTVAYHHWNGKIDPEWQRKAVNHIFSMQLPDGGWNIYYGGPSEVNATIKAYLALKLAGVPVTDPRMLQAREVALHLGGVPRMNTFSKLYLALLGLFPWQYVPTIPCEVLLIGKWFHVNFWDMSNWSRGISSRRVRRKARSASTNFIPKECTSATWRSPATRNVSRCEIFSSGSIGCTSSPNASHGAVSIRSASRR